MTLYKKELDELICQYGFKMEGKLPWKTYYESLPKEEQEEMKIWARDFNFKNFRERLSTESLH